MKKSGLTFIGLVVCMIQLFGQQNQPTYILLKNASIITCLDGEVKIGDLLIKNERIESIDYQQSIDPPKGVIIYDLTDQYIMPGLIDAHVHFATDPSGSDNLVDTKMRLEQKLKLGITSVRDMAGDARVLAFLSRAAALNEIRAPDIYYASLMAGKTFFDDPRTHMSAKGVVPGDCAWMKGVDIKTNIGLAMAEAKGIGATGIKIYADLDAKLIQKIVLEAHKLNLKVWSHATVFPAKPLELVMAGVDVVSHANLLAWEGVDSAGSSAKRRYEVQNNFDIDNLVFKNLFRSMYEQGTILDATLALYQLEVFDSSIFLQGIKLAKLAHNNGVKIGVGTDISLERFKENFSEGTPLHREMQVLVEHVGMKPLEVLKSATIINAEMMGLENQIGSLTVGKQADIIVLNKNPLLNIKNIQSIKHVFKRGKHIAF